MDYKVGDRVFVKDNWLSHYGKEATIIEYCGDNFYYVKYDNGIIQFVGSKLLVKLNNTTLTKETISGSDVISNISDFTISFNTNDGIKDSVIEILEDTLNSLKEIQACKYAPCNICEHKDVGLYCEDEHSFKWKYEDKAIELLKKLRGD